MFYVLSGEFFLESSPNGGAVILKRSLWVATFTYLFGLAFKAVIDADYQWAFELIAARALISETLPWFGAIFAGVYAALYARFSSQWSYVADLYNQIMATAVQVRHEPAEGEPQLSTWWAGFIEDAEDLHLATKPMFAGVIRSLLDQHRVRSAFVSGTAGGEARLLRLQAAVNEAWVRAERKYSTAR
jgi:hypothetical protein